MQPQPTSSSNPAETESRVRRRIIGFFMFPIALFPLLALCTYNWRDISDLCIPASASTNLVGIAGDWFAYIGYQFVGLGIWSVPAICVYMGLRLILGNTCHPGRRTIGVVLLVFSATCLLQVAGTSPTIAPFLRDLNIEPNAGGAVGYLVMTRCLVYHLAPFGASVLMICLAVLSLFIIAGPRNIVSGLARLTDWAADRHRDDDLDDVDDPDAAAAAARAAKEAALAARLAEKQRIADEKAAAKAAKEEERERERIAREERKAAREAERAAKEAERAAREAEREAERLAREEQRRKEEAEREAIRARLKAEREASANGPIDFFPPRETPAARPATAPAITPVRTVAPQPPQPPPTPAATPAPAAATAPEGDAPADKGPYIVPSTDLLNPVPKREGGPGENVAAMAQRLIDTLKVFDVNAELAYYVAGPVVTQYALTLDLGTRVEKVAGLARNLQMALQATSLRIEAPIPGKNAVGIEVPNLKPASVHFREIIDGELWQKNSPGKFQVPLLLGKDAAGHDLVVDLAKLPHLLVAGATGQGKSVCLNSIINGLLMCRTPQQLKFIMVDPKRVEFTSYNQLPHLLVPIINDTKKVVFALRAALVEMEKRLKMFARAGCRNIVDFNTRKTVAQPDMFGGEEQLGDKDMPRTILDAQGSEQLIGKGDMLFKMSDGRLLRAQGSYISDDEINRIIEFIGEHSNPEFDEALTKRMAKVKEDDPSDSLDGDGDGEGGGDAPPPEPMATTVVGGVPPPAGMTASKEEGLFRRALEVVRDTKRASISHLQRRMGIGYNHAARIMDLLEERGVIGPARGAGPREILVDPETLLNGGADASAGSSDAPDAAFSLPPDPSEEDPSTI